MFVCQERLRLSREVDECKPLPSTTEKYRMPNTVTSDATTREGH